MSPIHILILVFLYIVILTLPGLVFLLSRKLKSKALSKREPPLPSNDFAPRISPVLANPVADPKAPISSEVISKSIPSSSSDRHLLNLVDLLDEIAVLKKAGGGTSLEIVESRIRDLILLSDGEIIHDAVWNPERQRAVEVVKGDDPGITLISARSSGLTVKGRIVKKEEVVISKPNNS